MAETLKLRNTDRKVREFFAARRQAREECVIEDENGQAVAVLLPMELYQLYQEGWERPFAVIDRIREKMKGVDPDELQARIDRAAEEVKAEARAIGTIKRYVDPAEFVPHKTKLKGPLTRALAYEE